MSSAGHGQRQVGVGDGPDGGQLARGALDLAHAQQRVARQPPHGQPPSPRRGARGPPTSSSASTVASSPPRSAKIARPAAARPFQPGCPLADSSATRGTSWRTSSSSRCHQPTRPRLAIATSSASRSPSARRHLGRQPQRLGRVAGVGEGGEQRRRPAGRRSTRALGRAERPATAPARRRWAASAVAQAARSTPGSRSSSPALVGQRDGLVVAALAGEVGDGPPAGVGPVAGGQRRAGEPRATGRGAPASRRRRSATQRDAGQRARPGRRRAERGAGQVVVGAAEVGDDGEHPAPLGPQRLAAPPPTGNSPAEVGLDAGGQLGHRRPAPGASEDGRVDARGASANPASSSSEKRRSSSPSRSSSPCAASRASGIGGGPRLASTRWPLAGRASTRAESHPAPSDPSGTRWASSRTRHTCAGASATRRRPRPPGRRAGRRPAGPPKGRRRPGRRGPGRRPGRRRAGGRATRRRPGARAGSRRSTGRAASSCPGRRRRSRP